MKDCRQEGKEAKLKELFESIEYKNKFLTSRGVLVVCNDISELSSAVLESNPEILNLENVEKLTLEARIKRDAVDFKEVARRYNEYLAKNNSKKNKNHTEFLAHINKYWSNLKFYSEKQTWKRYVLSISTANAPRAVRKGVGYFLVIVAPNFDFKKNFKYKDRTNVITKKYYDSIFNGIYYEIPEDTKKSA
ncbi:hypothetical protein [Pseudomonas syringae]|uniref:hypothetical protein n=1 Tax=Pseudomonas syringae TaxID=317 RepID=UPI000A1FEAEC|nr:hypothetical protein [Pseudomonas syringae]OSO49002.1 hypothetical protein BV364_00012 [Pseudomonas syringae pv. actinidiae]